MAGNIVSTPVSCTSSSGPILSTMSEWCRENPDKWNNCQYCEIEACVRSSKSCEDINCFMKADKNDDWSNCYHSTSGAVTFLSDCQSLSGSGDPCENFCSDDVMNSCQTMAPSQTPSGLPTESPIDPKISELTSSIGSIFGDIQGVTFDESTIVVTSDTSVPCTTLSISTQFIANAPITNEAEIKSQIKAAAEAYWTAKGCPPFDVNGLYISLSASPSRRLLTTSAYQMVVTYIQLESGADSSQSSDEISKNTFIAVVYFLSIAVGIIALGLISQIPRSLVRIIALLALAVGTLVACCIILFYVLF